jgi:hypothetical protein
VIRRGCTPDQRGTALLLALVLTAALAAIVAVLALAARTETLIAGRFAQGLEGRYLAHGALERVLADFETSDDWTPLLAEGRWALSVSDPTVPLEIGGARLTLCCGPDSVSAEVQRRAGSPRSFGGDTPIWRLYAWAPAAAWEPAPRPFYAAVWVADDPDDGDGDPLRDGNGRLSLMALAFGPGGTRAGVRAVVGRPRPPDGSVPARGVLRLSWLETRW